MCPKVECMCLVWKRWKLSPGSPATQNKKDGLDYLCRPLPFLRISCLDSSGAFWVFSFMSRSLLLLDFGSEHLTLICDALHYTAAVVSHSITWCGKTWPAHKPMQCIIISCQLEKFERTCFPEKSTRRSRWHNGFMEWPFTLWGAVFTSGFSHKNSLFWYVRLAWIFVHT